MAKEKKRRKDDKSNCKKKKCVKDKCICNDKTKTKKKDK